MLTRNQFFIREHVGLFKLSDTYDIVDPTSGKLIGAAKERVGTLIHVLRLVMDKGTLPTTVEIIENPDEHGVGRVAISLKRGVNLLFRSKTRVLDHDGHELGYFMSKLLSFGGGFWLHDTAGTRIAEVKGNWKGWDFKLLDLQGKELGTVTKQWTGLGKELFTSADNYMVDIATDKQDDLGLKALLLAAAIAIDTIYKETG